MQVAAHASGGPAPACTPLRGVSCKDPEQVRAAARVKVEPRFRYGLTTARSIELEWATLRRPHAPPVVRRCPAPRLHREPARLLERRHPRRGLEAAHRPAARRSRRREALD